MLTSPCFSLMRLVFFQSYENTHESQVIMDTLTLSKQVNQCKSQANGATLDT